MSFANIFQNYNLLTVGIAIAASIFMGFVVYFHNRRSITGKIFLFFTIASSAWGVVNYMLYQFEEPAKVLLFIRLVMFFAIWQAFSFFLLSYTFPQDKISIPKLFKYILIPLTIIISLSTLTSFVFHNITKLAPAGEVSQAAPGPGIVAFGLLAISLVVGGIVLLVRRVIKTKGEEKSQLKFFLWGVFSMFLLIIVLNFILPNLFKIYTFIPYGATFTFPFIVLTSYSILKHHLFNIKVIATEISVFLLVFFSFFEVLFSQSTGEILFRLVIFVILFIFSILLVRSVLNEVQQREQLQILTKKLKDANSQLKALDQARAEFISIASHQLRTPPATIKWYLGAVLSGDYGNLGAEVKTILQKTERTNNLLIALIEDLLNVSRIERGKMEFYFEQTDVEDLIQVTFEQLEPIAKEKGLKLAYQKPLTKLPVIMADKEKLRQVINNLIDNAIKYTSHGCVIIGLNLTDENEIRVKVTDTGRGVEQGQIHSIFQKYTRGRLAATQSTGLGLGLYVAKIIIEQHKGKIWVESPGEGKGSTFVFTLPINNGLTATSIYDFTASSAYDNKAVMPAANKTT